MDISQITLRTRGDNKLGVVFKIEGIQTDRSIDGKSIVDASAIHNGDKLMMKITIDNKTLCDREKIKSLLMECYSHFTETVKVKPIAVGDFL